MRRAVVMLAGSLGLLGAGAGCGGPWMPVATEADAHRAAVSVEVLNQGRARVLDRCGECHTAPSPRDHRAGEWPALVEDMRERSHLTPAEAEAVTRYLTAFAQDRAQ